MNAEEKLLVVIIDDAVHQIHRMGVRLNGL